MEGVKRRRSAQRVAITKICRKLHKAQAEDESLLVIPHLERHLSSLKSAFETYKAIHQELAECFPDNLNSDEEDGTLEQQSDIVEDAERLG